MPRPSDSSQKRPSRHPYAFTVEVARELVALLCDDEGDADEDLLDLAKAAVRQPVTITTSLKQQRDSGQMVIFDLTGREVRLVRTTIDNWGTPASMTRHLGDILRKRLPEYRNTQPRTVRAHTRHG